MVSGVEPKDLADAVAPGSRIGKYTVLRLLAVGGSAEVYLVESHGIEGFAKLAVLKRLLPHLVGHPDFVEMFLNEARLAANLHHPNIAQVYDFGRSGPSHYLTMEYVEGESLASVIRAAARKQRGFSLANSLRVAQSVAEALHYAHRLKGADGKPLGIVHRDVSSNNVMITFDGSVKLVDFGIATAHISKNQTRTGAIKGSLRYMSPEQCAGESIDSRSDIFSLGVLLFELTTGTRIHRDCDERDLLARVQHDPIPIPSTRREDYPPELERIVMTALERDRSRRYGTAQALQVELESFARDRGISASSVGLAEFMQEIFGERRIEARPRMIPLEAESTEPSPGDRVARVRRLWLSVGALLLLGCMIGLALLWASGASPPIVQGPEHEGGEPSFAPSMGAAQSPEGSPEPRTSAYLSLETGTATAATVAELPVSSPSGSLRHEVTKSPRDRRATASGMVPAKPTSSASPKPAATWTLDSPLPP